MKELNQLILKARVWGDTRGQDMVEYALIMGLVAVAAGSIMSGISTNIGRVFSLIAAEVAPGANQTGTGG